MLNSARPSHPALPRRVLWLALALIGLPAAVAAGTIRIFAAAPVASSLSRLRTRVRAGRMSRVVSRIPSRRR